MTLKRWVLGKVNGTVAPGGRDDARRVAPSLGEGVDTTDDDAREPHLRGGADTHEGRRTAAAHLGPYASLVGAISEELETFAATQLRQHLAIAERDRYVLTSIEVECTTDDEHRELLRRFVGEFRPEQIKHYLAKEVIAALRNASAIDLSQFAGLNAAQAIEQASDEEDGYDVLLEQLRSSSPEAAAARPYEVKLLGRWSQADPNAFGAAASRAATASRAPEGVHTPLAARAFVVRIEDARGPRSVELASVVAGRRYSVGKDESCDVVIDGVYASRRHCEIWFDHGTWWVADAGSTNGIRVEQGDAARGAAGAGGGTAMELRPGTWVVLSAEGRGAPDRYPRLMLELPEAASAADAERGAPATPIAPARRRGQTFTIAARTSSGAHEARVAAGDLPFGIGRSRNQGLVIDWAHDEVSGLHLEIASIDAEGAEVLVHGDNGVLAGDTPHEAGARFRWQPGQTLVLGRGAGERPPCTLTLRADGSA